MVVFELDDTGVVFNSLTELAKFLGCVPSNINWYRTKHSDRENHFWYHDYPITVIKTRNPNLEKRKQWSRQYYQGHKEYFAEYMKRWRVKNRDKIREYSRREHQNHREWYNAYYREYHKRKKNNLGA